MPTECSGIFLSLWEEWALALTFQGSWLCSWLAGHLQAHSFWLLVNAALECARTGGGWGAVSSGHLPINHLTEAASETGGEEHLHRVFERGGAWCPSGSSQDTVVVGVPLGNLGELRRDLKSWVRGRF